ncbi:MAG: Ig-like domain repeat protein, partial [Terracidiphilus sp.]
MSRLPDRVARTENRESNLAGLPTAAPPGARKWASRGQSDRGSATAAVKLRDALGRSRSWMLALAALLLAAAGAHAQATFGSIAVGFTTTQTVTVTSPAGGTVNSVEVLTAGSSTIDFTAGSTYSCNSAVLGPGGTCTQSVTFAPIAPGVRTGAVVLLDASNNVLGTAYLSGIGLGGLGVLAPGNLTPVAGKFKVFEPPINNGGPATLGVLNQPSSMVLDGAGNMYIADTNNHMIRMVCAGANSGIIAGTAAACTNAGIITTIVGTGYTGETNGPAASATLDTPWGVALDGAGNLYIADTNNNAIRMVTASTGIVTTVAGNGSGCPGQTDIYYDGCPATSAILNQPRGVTIDRSGNIFIADSIDNLIRRVDAITGIITTVAGNGAGGYLGDKGAAGAAELNLPFAVAFDSSGNMYIPDSLNNVVRLVTAVGGVISGSDTITTFAGTGTANYTGDGTPATSATLDAPSGVVVDPAGNVFISDTQNNAIRKVYAPESPYAGQITSYVVTGIGQYYIATGPTSGTFTNIALYGPIGLFLDSSANLYIANKLDMEIQELLSNSVYLDAIPEGAIRQGTNGAPIAQYVENDGNATLDVTDFDLVQNVAVSGGAGTAGTVCKTGVTLAADAPCGIGAELAPDPILQITTPYEIGIIDVGQTGDTINAPLVITVVGTASKVNSTTTTLTSSVKPSVYGALPATTFTATVTTGTGTGNLTGTVSFIDNSTTPATTLATVALNPPAGTTSTATYATTDTTLAVGNHSITATYNGGFGTSDPNHFASTSNAVLQVVNEYTTTTLKPSANPSVLGVNVTLTATITTPDGGGMAPDGTVTFTDNGSILGSLTVTAGVATLTTNTLPQGLNPITATYSGDSSKNILGSTSSVLNQDVQAASSTTAVVSSLISSYYGQSVTFTVTVTPGVAAYPATGLVNILDGGVQIAQVALVGATNQTTYTTATLTAGTHNITAVYQGDTYNSASTGTLVPAQVVVKTQTSTTVVAVPNSAIARAPVAITATVKVTSGGGTPTGTVVFTNGAATMGSTSLTAGGTATINPVLGPGQYNIVATYSGDSNDNGSASAPPYVLTVNLATTQTVVTPSPNPSRVLSPVTFTAVVTGNGGIPTGPVTFLADGVAMGPAVYVDGTGTATFTYAGLAAEPHQITASYAGDANDLPSVSFAITLVVNVIPTLTDLGSSTTTGPNPQVILVASVINNSIAPSLPTPTGTVTFLNGATVLGSSPLDPSGVAILVPNLASGTYTVTAYYSGDLEHGTSTSPPIQITVPATGFELTVNPSSVTLAATQNTTVTVTLTSDAGFAD